MDTSKLHFFQTDIHVGKIIDVQPFPEARKPAWKLLIDFGPLGIRKSSAQITELYTKEQLIGKEIIAVLNLPPKQIGKFISECLVLGVPTSEGVVLLSLDGCVPLGSKIS